MKNIRRYAYAAVLTLSVLSFAPSLASAQEARGSFKLTHDVRWQNVNVPAGEYKFKVAVQGPSQILTLSKVSGSATAYMILVNDAEAAAEAPSLGRLLLVSREGKSFVSEMELPEIGTKLHFNVPAEPTQIARAATVAAAASR